MTPSVYKNIKYIKKNTFKKLQIYIYIIKFKTWCTEYISSNYNENEQFKMASEDSLYKSQKDFFNIQCCKSDRNIY